MRDENGDQRDMRGDQREVRGDLWQSSSSCFQARLGVSLSQSSSAEWNQSNIAQKRN